MLNTAIRGAQIKDGEIGLTQLSAGVNTSLGLADSAYQLPGGGVPASDMAAAVQTSLGLADSSVQPGDNVSDLVNDEGYIKSSEVDDVTIEFASGNILQVKALGIDTAQIAGDAVDGSKIADDSIGAEHINAGAETAGYVLTTDAVGGLSWTAKTAITEDYIQESEIVTENVSSQIDDTGFAGDFTISSSPVASSVQVYLNGLLQEEGTGKDYLLSGTTISFSTAPVSGDIVIVHYIKT